MEAKPLRPLLLLLVAFSVITYPTAVRADFFYPYFYSSDGSTVTITGYGGSRGNEIIPNTIIGLPVTSIGGSAFLAASITHITVGSNVTSIGASAFSSCASLTGVLVPASVTSIGDFAFYDCPNLTDITVVTNNPAYSSVNGVLFNHSQTTLIQYPGSKAGNFSIPAGVNSVGNYAFHSCAGLTNLTVPASVNNIGYYAFAACTNLTGAYFKGNAPALNSYAFANATNTTVYYLPNTFGWGTLYGTRPTKLWNPQVQTASPTFGPKPGGFGLPITGTTNIPIVIEAATDLTGTAWTPLHTCTITNGSLYFTDADMANHPARFYRIRSP